MSASVIAPIRVSVEGAVAPGRVQLAGRPTSRRPDRWSRRVVERRPRFAASRAEREALADRFFGAVVEGDIDGLVALLAEDVVVQGDGGRKAPQWSHPIAGAARAARL